MDEHAFLREASALHGVDTSSLEIRRVPVEIRRDFRISALLYGRVPVSEVDMVMIHGGAQNAHTWDVTMGAAKVPALAFDLPGHGRSSRYTDADYSLTRMGGDIARAIKLRGVRPKVIVGMSIGGMVALSAARQFDSVQAVVLIDVSPDARPEPRSRIPEIRAIGAKPYEEFVLQVAQAGGTEVDAKMRHGVWHAMRATPDGTREWLTDPAFRATGLPEFWPDLKREESRLHMILADHGSFVPQATRGWLSEFLRPGRVSQIAGSRHSVQGSRPRELAAALVGILNSVDSLDADVTGVE